jgi:glyoxylase-like metal-dependent hydrolase (beta-lactamase superfamily II)
MRVTGVAQRDAWRSRTMPLTEQVRPDLWSIPVPIPGNPLRYTLSYLIAGDSGLVLVDPGMDTEPTWQALQAGLAEAGAAVTDLTGIVVTHVHPDHHGLSGRLREQSGAWIAMHPVERDSLPARIWDEARGPAGDRDWLRSCGVPADVAAELAITPEGVRWVLAMVEPTMLLGDGDLVPLPGRRLRAVWTPGHTPGHLCLHEETEDVLLTGDHVLPRISPNIGLQPHAAEPPLAAYLTSLKRTAGYDSAEALPAHEYRFHGLADRARMLLAHHDRRCAEVLAVTDRLGAATVWQITQELSWSRGWGAVTGMMRRAALAETAAHLEYLSGTGQIDAAQDAPGPVRYLRAASAPDSVSAPG